MNHALIARTIARHGIAARLARIVPPPAIPPEIPVRVAPMQFTGPDATDTTAGGQVSQAKRRWMIAANDLAGDATFANGPKPNDRLILDDTGQFGTVIAVDAGRAHGHVLRYDMEVSGL